jgi:M61 glycyl aminopeptidase
VVAMLPWAGSGADFEIPETAFAWKSGGAFTHSALQPLAAVGAELELGVLGGGFSGHDEDVRHWLEQGVRTSSLLFGRFPVPRALVILVPGARKGPAFGMALRGGGPAVVIHLDRNSDAASLSSDWTCTHELLHLGVPRLPPEDAWLFEGLATYYTEVTRARAGIISPAQAYQHLLDGFARGRNGVDEHTLRDASREMRARHAFFRVYWSGAALAFLTDVASRRAGGNTLDSALRSFAACCAASEDDWTAERVLAQLDASLGAPRFTDQAKTWLDRKEFPDLDATWRALGIAPGSHAEALLTPAPDARLRDAIMARESDARANREPHQGQ